MSIQEARNIIEAANAYISYPPAAVIGLLRNAANELLDEVDRLREALEWYASYANWMDADPPDYNSRAAHDGGKKARRALGEEPK